ncbi:hypothetical protein MNEG_5360 [Monoraphidium neglectum]|uniref:FAS1 domain-containing protein n=1 Tax=Monoraphidium neglectum TaxID=145388 RepID=A0A0D2JUU3_9CHLO|nr:hypothetical protein MNEG_5360 [Monoraphidium neglectum]KIZ02598.1 hypothetical protein MNEG_5360 [Monoraphidium neglectum]|eukprot:XP_013901617.1 hypothetical protein MNEG_5360 [Monoraphidium neglectum]
MGAAHAAAHPRAHPKPLVFETFYEALNKVPNTNKGKMIVDGLKLQPTLSNPKLALTVFMPEDKYFDALSRKLNVNPNSMGKNVGLMKQVLFYHFVTGSGGERKLFTTKDLKPGMKLDSMKPYQLAVSENKGKIQIRSVGTSAYIIKPNIRAGAGVAHIINNVLIPMTINQIPRF